MEQLNARPHITFREVNGITPTTEEKKVLDIALHQLVDTVNSVQDGVLERELKGVEKSYGGPWRAAWDKTVIFNSTLRT